MAYQRPKSKVERFASFYALSRNAYEAALQAGYCDAYALRMQDDLVMRPQTVLAVAISEREKTKRESLAARAPGVDPDSVQSGCGILTKEQALARLTSIATGAVELHTGVKAIAQISKMSGWDAPIRQQITAGTALTIDTGGLGFEREIIACMQGATGTIEQRAMALWRLCEAEGFLEVQCIAPPRDVTPGPALPASTMPDNGLDRVLSDGVVGHPAHDPAPNSARSAVSASLAADGHTLFPKSKRGRPPRNGGSDG
jgi:hypothetical protein